MFEGLLAVFWAVVSSPYFAPAAAFVFGWLGIRQPRWIGRFWGYVLGIRTQLVTITQLIDTIDAILKANGIIPADAPKLEEKEVRAVMDGKVSVDTLAKAQRARLAAKRAQYPSQPW